MSGPSIRARIDERLRMMQIYEVFLRYGSDAVFERGIAGDVRRSLQGWFYETRVEPLTAPEKVRLLLQELGPTYVKLGQIVSTRAETLPPEWEAALARLQNDVRPFGAEQAREVIAAELGAAPEDVFEEFDPQPLAAASLGQVHRATLKDGREVAVKVQRPNIEGRVRSDLLILSGAARRAERHSGTARDLGVRQIISEFGGALMLELDYRLEAYNARRLARNLASLDRVAVPEVMREFSRQRVLTMSFVHGVPANDRDAIIAAGLVPEEVADAGVRAAIKMIMIDGFFHADPHPGNVMVDLDTGVLTFIDTGMVGQLGLRQRLNLIALLHTVVGKDPQALAQSLRALSRPFRATDPARFDAEFVRHIGPLMDLGENERLDLPALVTLSLTMLRDGGYRPDAQLSLAMKALTQSAEFMRALYPERHASAFADRATEITRELTAEALTEERIAGFAKRQAGYAAREAAQSIPSLQDATKSWLRQFQKGRFEVRVDTSDLAPRVAEIGAIVRNLTLGLVLIGVLIGSAIAAKASHVGPFGFLPDAAAVVYAIVLVPAVIFIAILTWQALRRATGPDDVDRE